MGVPKIKRIGSAFSFLLLVSIIGYFTSPPFHLHSILPGEPSIQKIASSNTIDTSNRKALVGFSDHVFVGKVVKQTGTKALNKFPETQFEVRVLENIKGTLTGKVIVNQQGGYEWNRLILMEGDQLVEEGQTYLFATKYLAKEQWHTVVPVHGDLPIYNDKHQKELVESFEKAYENEIPFTF